MPKNLKDLRTSLLNLSQDELLQRLRDVRDDRKVSKTAISVRAARTKKKSDNIVSRINSLSPEARAALIADLERDL
jgi:hypothetical protein